MRLALVDAEHDDLSGVLAREALERGQLRLARRTPGRPEVQQHDPSAVARQRIGAAVGAASGRTIAPARRPAQPVRRDGGAAGIRGVVASAQEDHRDDEQQPVHAASFGMSDTIPFARRASRVRAGGVTLATFETGSRASDAPVVLLLHGLGHWSEAAWSRLVPLLDPALRYVALDLPGFGASEKPAATYDAAYFRARRRRRRRGARAEHVRAGRTLAGRFHRRRLCRRTPRARLATRADRAGGFLAHAALRGVRARPASSHRGCSRAPRRGASYGARSSAASPIRPRSIPTIVEHAYELAQDAARAQSVRRRVLERAADVRAAPGGCTRRSRAIAARSSALGAHATASARRARCATSCASIRKRRPCCSHTAAICR